eukprot:7381071-Prymnesium_polylepis.1
MMLGKVEVPQVERDETMIKHHAFPARRLLKPGAKYSATCDRSKAACGVSSFERKKQREEKKHPAAMRN